MSEDARHNSEEMKKVLVLHGPNLNLLGQREPEIYGPTSLPEIDAALAKEAANRGATLCAVQSNHEGGLIDALHEGRDWADGILLNPGGYTHTSVALRDAIVAVGLPAVEVHLTNTASREGFRRRSLVAPVCVGTVAGFGPRSYILGLIGLLDHLAKTHRTSEGGSR